MPKKPRRVILIVDDNNEVLEILKQLLEDYEYSVVAASSGLEALQKLEEITPNLILLDISMPQMDGIEVLNRIKRNPKTSSIPVIMLTAKIDTGTIWKAQEMGACDYIVKPFKTAELLKWIRTYET